MARSHSPDKFDHPDRTPHKLDVFINHPLYTQKLAEQEVSASTEEVRQDTKESLQDSDVE